MATALDKQTLSVLHTVTGLLSTGGATLPVVVGMLPGLVAALRLSSAAVAEEAVETLAQMALMPGTAAAMRTQRVPEYLVRARCELWSQPGRPQRLPSLYPSPPHPSPRLRRSARCARRWRTTARMRRWQSWRAC